MAQQRFREGRDGEPGIGGGGLRVDSGVVDEELLDIGRDALGVVVGETDPPETRKPPRREVSQRARCCCCGLFA
jgi:hypothetical protein